MNPIQKESDLSKSEMLYSFKQIRLKRFGHFLAKRQIYIPHIIPFFWMSVVPALLFLKGPG